MARLGFLCACALAAPQDTPVALLSGSGIELLERDERRAVAGGSGVETLAWDRDGEHLLVTRAGRLERLPLDGGTPTTLCEGWLALRMPDVAPDGARIVFAATRADAPEWHVVLLERASGATRVLCDGYDPCFARDGASVFCERYPERDLWRFELASGALARALAPPADRYTVQADPLADRLAFSSEGRLVLRELASGAETILSPQGPYDRFASFAPDGRHLLFFREHGQPGEAFRGVREHDLATREERTLVTGDVWLAAYAPPTLARFVELARTARGERDLAACLPLAARPDEGLRRHLEREARAAGRVLWLPGLTKLAPAEAAALRTFTGAALGLPDLAALDAPSAAILAGAKCSLLLDGLAALDVPTARALAAWRGNGEQLFLSLDGLQDPPLAVLAGLAACRGWGLSLGGLRALTPAMADALAPLQVSTLDLDALEHVDLETAQAISRWQVKTIGLRAWRVREPAAVALVAQGCARLVVPDPGVR